MVSLGFMTFIHFIYLESLQSANQNVTLKGWGRGGGVLTNTFADGFVWALTPLVLSTISSLPPDIVPSTESVSHNFPLD